LVFNIALSPNVIELRDYQPHPLYPPLLSRRGGRILKRGAKPLLDTLSDLTSPLRRGGLFDRLHPFNLPSLTKERDFREGQSPSLTTLPLPLLREGGQGDRLPSSLLRGLTQSKVSKGRNKLSALSL